MPQPPSEASNIVYSAVGLLVSFLLIIQLPVHFQPTKSTNWLFILWVVLALLTSCINAIVWNDNTVNWAPAWCDITSNIIVAERLGVPLSLLCIARQLYGAVSGKVIYHSHEEERRRMLWDIIIAVGIPLLFLPLTYIVEGNDFLIAEQEGCFPYIPSTAPGIVLFAAPPAIFAIVSAIYSALNIYIMLRRRAQAREFKFEDVGNDSYHWRLTLLASAEIGFILPPAIFRLVWNSMRGLYAYNWNSLHAGFSNILTIPTREFAGDTKDIVMFELLDHWMLVGYALIFLAFFGWTKRARNHYKRYYVPVVSGVIRIFGYRGESAGSGPQEASTDLERASRGRGLVFRTFITTCATSFGASHVTSIQTTTTYHTAMEEVVSDPEAPAPAYYPPAHEHDPRSPQLLSVETPASCTENNDNVSPISPISRPKPAFLGQNHP